jgi:5-methylthioadenosine/S-adenosylhomocysteine deaminase
LEQQIGALTVSRRADVLRVRLDEARMTPTYNVVSNLIYAANADDVDTVVVEGRVLMRDGRILTLNIDKLRAEVAKLAAEIKAEFENPPQH